MAIWRTVGLYSHGLPYLAITIKNDSLPLACNNVERSNADTQHLAKAIYDDSLSLHRKDELIATANLFS
jgi:hypothetical protein